MPKVAGIGDLVYDFISWEEMCARLRRHVLVSAKVNRFSLCLTSFALFILIVFVRILVCLVIYDSG